MKTADMLWQNFITFGHIWSNISFMILVLF